MIADSVYPLKYKEYIKKYALQYGINPNLVAATIWVESHFNPRAVSPAGALGLMQLMPQTARGIARHLGEEQSFTANKLFDPETNIRYGTWYLAFNIRKYWGNVSLALIAYNGGVRLADYVATYKSKSLLNPETYYYYQKVQELKKIYDKIYGSWWKQKKKEKPKRPSLPVIVLLIKQWLGLAI